MTTIHDVINVMQTRYDKYPCSQDEFNDGYWQGYLDAINGLRKVFNYPLESSDTYMDAKLAVDRYVKNNVKEECK